MRPDLKAMKEAAEKATPGEWFEGAGWVFVPPADGFPTHALRNVLSGVPEAQENCAFVVATQPTAILSLIEYVEGLESALRRAQEVIDETREDLHQRRVGDWYPEGANEAAKQMSEDMRLIGNSLADVDLLSALNGGAS